MWELDHKESWAPKNWCFWTVVLEKTLKSHLGCKEIKPVILKGNQSWIFIGRTDAEAETPMLWPHDTKNWLIGKEPYAGKDWRQEEKGITDDETVGWHHWLDGHEFEQPLRVGDGQESLMCSSPWDHKELDMTERLNWSELNWFCILFTLHTNFHLYKEPFPSLRGMLGRHGNSLNLFFYLFVFPFIFISWRLITLQYCSGFYHTLTWISHGFTCVPHPEPSSHIPPHPIPLGHPSAPALSTCLMHPTWTGDLFHTW